MMLIIKDNGICDVFFFLESTEIVFCRF